MMTMGYIYITTNKITGKIYIGKHVYVGFDENYRGSSPILKYDIDYYGDENFTTEILFHYSGDDECELDNAERYYISYYKDLIGADMMYNISGGGNGGNVFRFHKDDQEFINNFKEKMTIINRERCNTEEFKQAISIASKKRYSNPDERIKQSIRVKDAWSDPELRHKQSERLKEYYSTHKKDNPNLMQKCSLTLNNETLYFSSIKELKKYMSEVLHFNPSNPSIKKMLDNNIPYHSFHSKFKYLDGMVISRLNKESVSTNGDECSHVE